MKQGFKKVRHPPYAGTQAVLRAVSLLKSFTDDRPLRALGELSSAAGLNKTTAFRLLTALESEGMVTRGPAEEGYRLGPELIALGSRALRSNDLRTASHPALQSLAEQTGETATLEVLADGQVLILDEIPGAHLVGSTQNIGTRWPAHATSTGKVLLAALPEAERRAVLRATLPRLTPKTITRAASLHRELLRARRQGYGTAIEELEAGYSAVAAPVCNHEGQTIAAISVGGPSLRLTRDKLARISGLVVDAAAQVSGRLGWTDRPDARQPVGQD